MKKQIKNPHVGQLIVVTQHPEATVYTVAEVGGMWVILQWREGTRHCSEAYDRFNLFEPTMAQIEYSIRAVGPLVSVNEIVEWA